MSEYLPANQLPIAKPKINELIIVETAYTEDPNTRVRGRIQIISYISAAIPDKPKTIINKFLFMLMHDSPNNGFNE